MRKFLVGYSYDCFYHTPATFTSCNVLITPNETHHHDTIRLWTRGGPPAEGTPEAVHHSLALDSGGSADLDSGLVRLLSNESNSPTAFSEGRVSLSESPGCLGAMEDDD